MNDVLGISLTISFITISLTIAESVWVWCSDQIYDTEIKGHKEEVEQKGRKEEGI